METTVTTETLREYAEHLRREDKSPATIDKYTRYARSFAAFAGLEPVTNDTALAFKEHLAKSKYTASGANGVIAAVNSLLSFMGLRGLLLKPFRVQRRFTVQTDRELNRSELERLVDTAEKRGRLRVSLVMQTMFATGARVSELRFITVECLSAGKTDIRLKGKTRTVFLPTKLCAKLRAYAKERGITSGPVFVTRGGKPLDRSNIWAEMKALCKLAGVKASKVFPHNLRHLFARTYYRKTRNLAELADVLGHSDVNTTRIYTAVSGDTYRKRLDSMHLIL